MRLMGLVLLGGRSPLISRRGGGSMLRGLEELIESRTHINTMTAEEPMTCVAIGTGKYVEFLAENNIEP